MNKKFERGKSKKNYFFGEKMEPIFYQKLGAFSEAWSSHWELGRFLFGNLAKKAQPEGCAFNHKRVNYVILPLPEPWL